MFLASVVLLPWVFGTSQLLGSFGALPDLGALKEAF